MILPTAYFPSIDYVYRLKYGEDVRIEAHENFVRQSERNRCELMSDKGVQRLSVPISWRHGEKMPLRSVEVDYSQPWQRTHLRTIKTCYASSPYFEHYWGDIEELLGRRDKYLFDYNFAITERLLAMLKVQRLLVLTDTFEGVDQRGDIGVDYEYYQVFSEKLDFVRNLSVLDMLFCEGGFIL